MPWPTTSRHERGTKTERLRGHAGVAQRKRRLARSNFLCERCLPDRVTLATVVDHIKPLSLGGSDEDSNTRNLCKQCHADVTAEQFGFRKRVRISLSGWPEE